MIFLLATAVARTRAATTDAGDGGAIGECNDLGGGMSGGESNLHAAAAAAAMTMTCLLPWVTTIMVVKAVEAEIVTGVLVFLGKNSLCVSRGKIEILHFIAGLQ